MLRSNGGSPPSITGVIADRSNTIALELADFVVRRNAALAALVDVVAEVSHSGLIDLTDMHSGAAGLHLRTG